MCPVTLTGVSAVTGNNDNYSRDIIKSQNYFKTQQNYSEQELGKCL